MKSNNKHISEEMKKENEEILALWRKMGLLKGLEEGSINEWRCAKSFQDMVNYCMENETGSLGAFETVVFPIIRRCLCTGKNRLHRIIKPEEIVNALSNTTIKETFDIIDKVLPIKGKVTLKSFGRKLIRNFCKKICLQDNIETTSCLDFINLQDESLEEKIKFFNDITECDFIAEMLVMFSEVIKYKLNKK